MKSNLGILIFLLLIVLFSCKANPSKIVLAKFDGGNVTLKETIEEYNSYSDDDKMKINNKNEYFKLIRKLALEKIIIIKANKDNLDNDKDFLSKINETKKKAAYNILKKKNVLDKININESDYSLYKKSYELYQIVKRTDTLDKNKITESKNVLKNISKNIKDFESFKAASKKYSEDITANDGGFVGNIRLGIMDEEIDKVMENLGSGKVSNVIETNAGLHIIFIKSIQNVTFDELLKDKKLYDMIYKQKVEKLENEWYENLINNFSLHIDKKELKIKNIDDTVIVKYKDKTITRREILKTVDNLRQGTFPVPTEEELYNLVKNMGLNLILEDEVTNSSMINSGEFKEKMEIEKNYLLQNIYIEKNLKIPEINDENIQKFYNDNLKTLFTFKQDNGKEYIQKIDEVKEFIKQKLETKNYQDARYNLYRKLVDDAHLKIEDKSLEEFQKEVKNGK